MLSNVISIIQGNAPPEIPLTEIFKSDRSPGENGAIYALGSNSFWEMKVSLVPLKLLGLKDKHIWAD